MLLNLLIIAAASSVATIVLLNVALASGGVSDISFMARLSLPLAVGIGLFFLKPKKTNESVTPEHKAMKERQAERSLERTLFAVMLGVLSGFMIHNFIR